MRMVNVIYLEKQLVLAADKKINKKISSISESSESTLHGHSQVILWPKLQLMLRLMRGWAPAVWSHRWCRGGSSLCQRWEGWVRQHGACALEFIISDRVCSCDQSRHGLDNRTAKSSPWCVLTHTVAFCITTSYLLLVIDWFKIYCVNAVYTVSLRSKIQIAQHLIL